MSSPSDLRTPFEISVMDAIELIGLIASSIEPTTACLTLTAFRSKVPVSFLLFRKSSARTEGNEIGTHLTITVLSCMLQMGTSHRLHGRFQRLLSSSSGWCSTRTKGKIAHSVRYIFGVGFYEFGDL